MNNMKIENIAVDLIRIIDEMNYSFPFSNSELENSIAEFSILSPIVVYKQSDNSYAILDGVKRFNILKAQGHSSIPCNVIASDSLFDGFISVAKMRQATQTLTLIEKAGFINVLVEYFKCSSEEMNSKYLKLVKLPFRKNVFELMIEVSSFSDEVQLFLHKNKLPINDLFQIRLLDEKNKQNLISFVESFNVSYSNLKQIIELMIEISAMKGVSINDIIKNDDIKTILENEKLASNKKIPLIKNMLIKLRYPIVVEYQEAMAAKLGDIKMKSGMSISYPKELEDDYLDIKLRVKSTLDLTDMIKQLSLINEQNCFDDIFSYMQSKFSDKM